MFSSSCSYRLTIQIIVFFDIALLVSWFCTLPGVQIGGSWFGHHCKEIVRSIVDGPYCQTSNLNISV